MFSHPGKRHWCFGCGTVCTVTLMGHSAASCLKTATGGADWPPKRVTCHLNPAWWELGTEVVFTWRLQPWTEEAWVQVGRQVVVLVALNYTFTGCCVRLLVTVTGVRLTVFSWLLLATPYSTSLGTSKNCCVLGWERERERERDDTPNVLNEMSCAANSFTQKPTLTVNMTTPVQGRSLSPP